ncbi:PBSX family phage terminase large subunit [Schaalia sp. ZJ405]|uniref:PBSX family phage terminase large subunit n=1 Tax=Schaalia sp. ZJ405 TaxID=2709403 RepID=UPI0013EC8C27|nr:PBSX family phage terminase large subunit [Schaalia sp. ZJ405]QPK81124.1 PBSX family phage terminase large subunit [Schaalia sp. ZJ405]
MELSLKQIKSWDASTSRDHFTLWDGAIRSGKTIISIMSFLSWLASAPHGPVAILGKTRITIIRNVLDVIAMIEPKAIGGYGLNSDRVKIMGRWVWIIGANDAQAESKIRGLTLAGAYVDEATLLPEAMFVQLLGRLSVQDARLFATTNPDSPAHWLKTNYIDRAHVLQDWGFHHFTMDDNPGLTPEYIAAKKKEFTGLWYRRFIQGEWVSAEGAVYDMWDPEKHVVEWDELPRMVNAYAVGIDYGTQNPTAALILAMGEDGILYFVDEWRLDSTNRGHGTWTDAEQSQALLNWLHTTTHAPRMDVQPRRIIVDPAAASFKVQLKQDGAWGLTDANNDVLYGIRLMANGLNAGWLKIANRCQGLIKETPGYSWDPKAQAAGTDKPIKTADHSLDAARYALATTERLWRRTVDDTAHRFTHTP